MSTINSLAFTAPTLTSRCVCCFTASQRSSLFGKCVLLNVDNCLHVSNQNTYTPNLHISALDDTTSVDVVRAPCELSY